VSRILLVQPNSGGTLSGGFLFNAQMAEHGAWELVDTEVGELQARLDSVDGDLVIADSLWLTDRSAEPFFRLARRTRVAALMHSFPSMIAAAETGQTIAATPTAFEIDALETIGLAIVPGPHYAELLRGTNVRVEMAEPGIVDAWRAPPRPRRGPCRLVSVGAVTRRKGFLDVLAALQSRPPRSPWRWTALGSLNADTAYARQVADFAKTFDTAELFGQRTPDEVRSIVTTADVLVMPSYDENHPLVLMEAIAASVPPVGYDVGGAARIVKTGVEGWLVPIGDKEHLGAHLARLIDDENERFRMAEACWQRQASLPTWSTAARRIRATLEAIAAAR
jgi:glycosyltransferase involved in cell wall biosynthesis